jgi:4-hydroxy-3-polyprenylbenzoate decarboxylase
LNQRFVSALRDGVSPRVVAQDDAPVQEHVRDCPDFTLNELPALMYSEHQAAPYITSAIIVARDPDSGAHNLSFHRLMMAGDSVAAIYMTPGGDLDCIWRKNASRGAGTRIAAVIGTHPLWCYGSLVSGPLASDDYAVLGGVLGAPIELVATVGDSDLLVPAHAEMVLEGEITSGDVLDEGPFGEFLGFDALAGERPAVRFSRMTCRTEPIYQDIVAGQTEHVQMSSVSLRARLHRDYFNDNPAVVDVWLPAAMTIFLAVDESKQPAFDANAMMRRLLEQEPYLKHAYCFDAGIDLRKLASVQSAIASFVQADSDIMILPSCDGNGVDPSERNGTTTKMAVDARATSAVNKTALPADFLDQFDIDDWIRGE